MKYKRIGVIIEARLSVGVLCFVPESTGKICEVQVHAGVVDFGSSHVTWWVYRYQFPDGTTQTERRRITENLLELMRINGDVAKKVKVTYYD